MVTGLVLVAASVAVFAVLGVVSYAAYREGYDRGFAVGRRSALSDIQVFGQGGEPR